MPAMEYARVADLYDLYVTTEIDIPFFKEEAKTRSRVLELMSGTGRVSIPLLEAGVPLTCLDSSPEMLALLRRKLLTRGLAARVVEADASSFAIPDRFDLIFIPFNSFSEITEAASVRRALATIRKHLSGEGRFICTLQNPAVRLTLVDGMVRVRGEFPLPEAGGTLRLSSVERYDDRTQCVVGTQFYERRDGAGVVKETRQLEVNFRLHTRASMELLLEEAGYRILELYGDYDRTAYLPAKSPAMIWVLEAEVR